MAVSAVAYFVGPAFILCCLTLILFGISCAQAYTFWTRCRKDPFLLKLCVFLVCILEIFHTVFVLHQLYFYLISSDIPILILDKVIWSVPALLLAAIGMIAMVQGFYIYRIYQLSNHNLYATAAPSLSLAARVGLAILTAILFAEAGTWTEIHTSTRLHVLITFGSSLNVFNDSLITLLFAYYLHTRKTPIGKTQSILRKWTIYTINTGALAIFASAAVIIMYLLSQSIMFAGMYTLVGKIYAFSMLAQLNSREKLRPQCTCTTGMGMHTVRLPQFHCSALADSSNTQPDIQVALDKHSVSNFSIPHERSVGGKDLSSIVEHDDGFHHAL